MPLGGRKQRALLAVLLLRANELVPTVRIVDELWGGAPPPTAVKAVQVHVSQLRKALGESRIVTRQSGYLLPVGDGELDLRRFEELHDRGRRLLADGEPAEAARALREALELWHGPPLAGLETEPFAGVEIARLEQLRLDALEHRLEAELALGRHAAAVPELEALVRVHPLRENLRRLLMLALYRSGRQADALEAYRDARRALVGELGLDPGIALQRLERAILEHDPALEAELGPAPERARTGRGAAAAPAPRLVRARHAGPRTWGPPASVMPAVRSSPSSSR